MAGHGARWWCFGPPTDTFQLVVGDPLGINVAIMTSGTKFIAGPTAWDHQAIRVRRTALLSDEPGAADWVVQDTTVGFRVDSDSLWWARNVDGCDPHMWHLWRPSQDAEKD